MKIVHILALVLFLLMQINFSAAFKYCNESIAMDLNNTVSCKSIASICYSNETQLEFDSIERETDCLCNLMRYSREDVRITCEKNCNLQELLFQDDCDFGECQVEICVNDSSKITCNISANDFFHQCQLRNLSAVHNVSDLRSSVTLSWVHEPLSAMVDSVNYLIYCQAHGSEIKHTVQYECPTNSTACTVKVTELNPNRMYECCVLEASSSEDNLQARKWHCINTTTIGYANATTEKEMCEDPTEKKDQFLVIPLSFSTGFLFLMLIVTSTMFCIVCNRMRKLNKSLKRDIQEFEMTSKYNARRDAAKMQERYLAIQKRDSNRKQPLYPPAQADDYLMPISTLTRSAPEKEKVKDKEKEKEKEEDKDTGDTDNGEKDTGEKDTAVQAIEIEDENPYQSLLAPKVNLVGEEGYVRVKLAHSASFSTLEGTPPPPIPPKPEHVSTLESDTPQLLCNFPWTPSEHVYSNRLQTL